MLDRTPHQTKRLAVGESVCIEVERQRHCGFAQRKPHAGMDMLAVLGRQFHAAQQLVRLRSTRNPNEVIEEELTLRRPPCRFGGALRRFLVVHHLCSAWCW